jgi:phosphoserine aminotransferase
MRKTTDRRKKISSRSQVINAVIKNSEKKIKKQGGSPSEISNKRKTVKKVYKDANKELKKLLIPKGK